MNFIVVTCIKSDLLNNMSELARDYYINFKYTVYGCWNKNSEVTENPEREELTRTSKLKLNIITLEHL